MTLLDELLDIALRHSPKEYRGMEGTLVHAMKFLSKFFLQFLGQFVRLPTFRTLWSQVLGRMEMYMKAKPRGKVSEKLQELIPELLRNMLQVSRDLLWLLLLKIVKSCYPCMGIVEFKLHFSRMQGAWVISSSKADLCPLFTLQV